MIPQFVLRFLIVIIVHSVIAEAVHYTEEYCWRDYDGTIPSDALAAGKDHKGEILYFGQTLYENKLVPGKIVQTQKKMFFEYYSKEYSEEHNVKILCTQNPRRFEWIFTNRQQIPFIKSQVLVKGGHEPNVRTYLGRSHTNGVTNIGKVICMGDDCYGLYITNDGATELIDANFEILVYDDTIDDSTVDTYSTVGTNSVDIVNRNPQQDSYQTVTIQIFKQC